MSAQTTLVTRNAQRRGNGLPGFGPAGFPHQGLVTFTGYVPKDYPGTLHRISKRADMKKKFRYGGDTVRPEALSVEPRRAAIQWKVGKCANEGIVTSVSGYPLDRDLPANKLAGFMGFTMSGRDAGGHETSHAIGIQTNGTTNTINTSDYTWETGDILCWQLPPVSPLNRQPSSGPIHVAIQPYHATDFQQPFVRRVATRFYEPPADTPVAAGRAFTPEALAALRGETDAEKLVAADPSAQLAHHLKRSLSMSLFAGLVMLKRMGCTIDFGEIVSTLENHKPHEFKGTRLEDEDSKLLINLAMAMGLDGDDRVSALKQNAKKAMHRINAFQAGRYLAEFADSASSSSGGPVTAPDTVRTCLSKSVFNNTNNMSVIESVDAIQNKHTVDLLATMGAFHRDTMGTIVGKALNKCTPGEEGHIMVF